MTYTEAAEKVLTQAGQPLHFREITRRAIAQGLIEVEGRTPWNSMNGTLRRAIRTQSDSLPIVALGDGRFALSAWGLPADDIGASDSAADQATDDDAMTGAGLKWWAKGEPISPLGLKWWALGQRLWALLTQRTSALPANVPLEGALRALLIWGGANLLSGLALLVGRTAPLTRGLGQQLLSGGATHAALALGALEAVVSQDEAVAAGRAPAARLTSQRAWLRQAYGLGALVGAFTLLRGLGASHAREDTARRGRGVGRVIQGSFMLLLAAAGLARRRQSLVSPPRIPSQQPRPCHTLATTQRVRVRTRQQGQIDAERTRGGRDGRDRRLRGCRRRRRSRLRRAIAAQRERQVQQQRARRARHRR